MSGLMSRCTIPARWAAAIASASCSPMSTHSSVSRSPRRIRSVRVGAVRTALLADQLERHLAAQTSVPGAPDHAHGTRAELFEKLESADSFAHSVDSIAATPARCVELPTGSRTC